MTRVASTVALSFAIAANANPPAQLPRKPPELHRAFMSIHRDLRHLGGTRAEARETFERWEDTNSTSEAKVKALNKLLDTGEQGRREHGLIVQELLRFPSAAVDWMHVEAFAKNYPLDFVDGFKHNRHAGAPDALMVAFGEIKDEVAYRKARSELLSPSHGTGVDEEIVAIVNFSDALRKSDTQFLDAAKEMLTSDNNYCRVAALHTLMERSGAVQRTLDTLEKGRLKPKEALELLAYALNGRDGHMMESKAVIERLVKIPGGADFVNGLLVPARIANSAHKDFEQKCTTLFPLLNDTGRAHVARAILVGAPDGIDKVLDNYKLFLTPASAALFVFLANAHTERYAKSNTPEFRKFFNAVDPNAEKLASEVLVAVKIIKTLQTIELKDIKTFGMEGLRGVSPAVQQFIVDSLAENKAAAGFFAARAPELLLGEHFIAPLCISAQLYPEPFLKNEALRGDTKGRRLVEIAMSASFMKKIFNEEGDVRAGRFNLEEMFREGPGVKQQLIGELGRSAEGRKLLLINADLMQTPDAIEFLRQAAHEEPVLAFKVIDQISKASDGESVIDAAFKALVAERFTVKKADRQSEIDGRQLGWALKGITFDEQGIVDLHVRLVDDGYLKPERGKATYLNVMRIACAAEAYGFNGVHFASEFLSKVPAEVLLSLCSPQAFTGTESCFTVALALALPNTPEGRRAQRSLIKLRFDDFLEQDNGSSLTNLPKEIQRELGAELARREMISPSPRGTQSASFAWYLQGSKQGEYDRLAVAMRGGWNQAHDDAAHVAVLLGAGASREQAARLLAGDMGGLAGTAGSIPAAAKPTAEQIHTRAAAIRTLRLRGDAVTETSILKAAQEHKDLARHPVIKGSDVLIIQSPIRGGVLSSGSGAPAIDVESALAVNLAGGKMFGGAGISKLVQDLGALKVRTVSANPFDPTHSHYKATVLAAMSRLKPGEAVIVSLPFEKSRNAYQLGGMGAAAIDSSFMSAADIAEALLKCALADRSTSQKIGVNESRKIVFPCAVSEEFVHEVARQYQKGAKRYGLPSTSMPILISATTGEVIEGAALKDPTRYALFERLRQLGGPQATVDRIGGLDLKRPNRPTVITAGPDGMNIR